MKSTKQREVSVSVPDYENPKPRANVLEISKLASELFEIENEIKAIDADYEAKVAPLKQIKDERRGVLLEMMKDAGQKHVDVNGGNNFYVRSVKSSFEVTDIEKAEKWAKRKGCLRIDKTLANQLLKREIKTPEGFEQVDTEFIKVQASKE